MSKPYVFLCLQHINQLNNSEIAIALKVIESLKINKAILGYSINEEENLNPKGYDQFKNSGLDCHLFVEYPLLVPKQFRKLSSEKMDKFFNDHERWDAYPYETPALGVFTPHHEFNIGFPDFLAKNEIRFGTTPSHFIDTKLKAKLKAPVLQINWSSFWGRRHLAKNMDQWITEANKFPYVRISLFANDLLHPRISELFTDFFKNGLSNYQSGNAEDLKSLVQLELSTKQNKS